MTERRPLRVLELSSEVAPLAKTGGVADVAAALPRALSALGHDVRVAMPRYGHINARRFALQQVLSGLAVPLDRGAEQASV